MTKEEFKANMNKSEIWKKELLQMAVQKNLLGYEKDRKLLP